MGAWKEARPMPALEDTDRHRPFADEVLREMGLTPGVKRSASGRLAAPAPSEPASPYAPDRAASFIIPGVTGSELSQAQFVGSEWQRPVREGELENLLQAAYWLADLIDRVLGREPRTTSCGQVPQ